MRTYKHPNIAGGWKCPICKKDTNEPVVLVGIEGTENNGNIEAEQFHISCIDLTYYKPDTLIMRFQ